MSTTSHDASPQNIQRALAIMVFTIEVLGAVTMLSVPFTIGLYGLRGPWLPVVFLTSLALQA